VSRLSNTLRLDFTLQLRYKVYVIVLGAALVLGLALRAVVPPEELHFFMPVLVLYGVSLSSVFLVGVLLLLERGEGTLNVVMVSPLRPGEYLASKLISLGALAVMESLIFAVAAFGFGFSALWLVAAVVIRAAMGVAVGVAIGVRYRSITRFLLPGIFASITFDIPNFWYLGVWPGPGMFLWPSMPPLLLAKTAFLPVDPWQLVYAFGYGSAVIAVALWWAMRSIERFAVRGEIAA
jgi:fluoroquinolone transport system permease protein